MMNKMAFVTVASLMAATAMLVANVSAANPDFTQGDKIPEGANHDWTLGPTGARGWMYSNRMETSEARQIYVTKVDEGSPADGVLQPGDVIFSGTPTGAGARFDPPVWLEPGDVVEVEIEGLGVLRNGVRTT